MSKKYPNLSKMVLKGTVTPAAVIEKRNEKKNPIKNLGKCTRWLESKFQGCMFNSCRRKKEEPDSEVSHESQDSLENNVFGHIGVVDSVASQQDSKSKTTARQLQPLLMDSHKTSFSKLPAATTLDLATRSNLSLASRITTKLSSSNLNRFNASNKSNVSIGTSNLSKKLSENGFSSSSESVYEFDVNNKMKSKRRDTLRISKTKKVSFQTEPSSDTEITANVPLIAAAASADPAQQAKATLDQSNNNNANMATENLTFAKIFGDISMLLDPNQSPHSEGKSKQDADTEDTDSGILLKSSSTSSPSIATPSPHKKHLSVVEIKSPSPRNSAGPTSNTPATSSIASKPAKETSPSKLNNNKSNNKSSVEDYNKELRQRELVQVMMNSNTSVVSSIDSSKFHDDEEEGFTEIRVVSCTYRLFEGTNSEVYITRF